VDFLHTILGFFKDFPWEALLQIIGGLSIVAAFTPTKVDNAFFGRLTPLINIILRIKELGAFNFAAAKNADDKE